MKTTRVEGMDRGEVLLFALSTCGWCRKTKDFLDRAGVAYRFVDVDLLPDREHDEALGEVRKWNPACSFPTLVVNGTDCIVGYQPDRLRELLGL